MKNENFQKAPKLFCENIQFGFTPEYFVIGMSSGAQSAIYTLTPQHAKRLLQYLGHEISSFEEKYDKINAEWNPHIVSPVQGVHPPSEKS